MDENTPPPKPRRRAAPIYLTEDERECIDRAAGPRGRGPWIRRMALYRAGWQGYSGPLFESKQTPEDLAAVEEAQIGDVLHELLRTMGEVSATCGALLKLGRPPRVETYSLLLQLARIIHKYDARLILLKRFDDSLAIAMDLQAGAPRLERDNAIAGSELRQIADLVLEALGRKDGKHG